MKLKKVRIINNKSCRKLSIDLSQDTPDIYIGINDSGKSTIFKSLDWFFDERKQLLVSGTINDISNSPVNVAEFSQFMTENDCLYFDLYTERSIVVICEFEIEAQDISNTNLQADGKANLLKWATATADKLVILKYQTGEGELSANGYYVLAEDYFDSTENNYLQAYSASATKLTELIRKFGITAQDIENQNGVGRYTNQEKIRAIYKKLEPELKQIWVKYDDFSRNKIYFPEFKYLDWNFTLKDLEDMATSAMKSVTERYLTEIQTITNEKEKQAQIDVNTKFNELMQATKRELPSHIKSIQSSVKFSVSQSVQDLTVTKDGTDGDIQINNQGDGIKRQIWFAILKGEATPSAAASEVQPSRIWSFDEPETHLHPVAQRNLSQILSDMTHNGFQILISTHSTIFIDKANIDKINQVYLSSGYTSINKSTCVNDILETLNVRNSDFLISDKFVCVEGPTEFELIPAVYKLINNRSMSEDGIMLINLNGSGKYKTMKEYLTQVVKDFGHTERSLFFLFDNDVTYEGANIFKIGKFDIEDSLPNSLWIQLVKDTCGIDLSEESINDEIRSKLGSTQSQKFYELLGGYVAKSTKGAFYLPSKPECAELIASYITDTSLVPPELLEFVAKLKEG